MIFRNHNACRPGVKALLDPDNIVRNGYYLYKKSSEILEFPVVYAPRKMKNLILLNLPNKLNLILDPMKF